jgi:PAS domain S-box-containing protein
VHSFYPDRNEDGTIVGVNCVVQDVTDRRRAEMAVWEAQEELKNLAEERATELRISESRLIEAQRMAEIGNWEWNLITDEGWWSAERYRLVGLDPETFKPTQYSFLETVHPEDRQRMRQLTEKAAKAGESYSEEFRAVLADGSVRHLHAQTEVICDEKGRPVRLAGTTQDITERVALEREVVAVGENERLRIGRDLHDGLGQELTGISLALQLLRRKLEDEHSPQVETVQNLTATIQNMIAEIRHIARQLSPVFSTELGLCAALKTLAKEVSEYSGVKCDPRCSFDDDIHDVEIATHLYRIAQESINNALRHGAAQNIELRYGRDGDSLFLEVLDDGTGIQAENNRVDGMGLRSMQYRARMLNGRLEVGLRSQGGTRVLCSCPSQSR